MCIRDSDDASTTGIIVNIKREKTKERGSFENEKDYENYRDQLKIKNHNNIKEIREVIKSFENIGKIYNFPINSYSKKFTWSIYGAVTKIPLIIIYLVFMKLCIFKFPTKTKLSVFSLLN